MKRVLEESPTRIVARLDHAGADRRRRPLRRWLVVVLALAAVIGAFLGVRAVSGDGAGDLGLNSVGSDGGDAVDQDRLEDLMSAEVGDRAGLQPLEKSPPVDGDENPSTTGAGSIAGHDVVASDLVRVGALEVTNGAVILEQVRAWHREDTSGRQISLADGASCWFGELDGAAQPSVICGPVGGVSTDELLFDLVPVAFTESVAGHIASVRTDQTVRDTVAPLGLVLVGEFDGPVPPPVSALGGQAED